MAIVSILLLILFCLVFANLFADKEKESWKIHKFFGAFLLLVLLAGCASTGAAEKWCRQGSITCQYWEYADCERIEGNCRQEWSKETDLSLSDRADCEPARPKMTLLYRTKDELKAFESCMKSKGYKKIEKGKVDLGLLHFKVITFPIEMILTGILAIPGKNTPSDFSIHVTNRGRRW